MNSSFSEQITCNTVENQREVVSLECWYRYDVCPFVAPYEHMVRKMNNCSFTFMFVVGANNPRSDSRLLKALNVDAFILIKPVIIPSCPFNTSSTRSAPVSRELCMGCGSFRRLVRSLDAAATTVFIIHLLCPRRSGLVNTGSSSCSDHELPSFISIRRLHYRIYSKLYLL